MKSSLKILFIVILASSMLVSCQKQGDTPLTGSGEDGTTIATVNGKPVTDKDVMFEVNLLPDELQQMAQTGEGLATIVDDVLKKEMLYQEAKKKNISQSEEYKRRLHDLERRLIVEMLLVQEIEKNAAVTDEEAETFYQENRDRFVAPSQEGDGKAKPVPFEEVKDLIKDRLLTQKQRSVFEEYIESLSKTYTVELNEDAIAAAFGISVGDKAKDPENNTGDNGTESTDEKPAEQTVPEDNGPENHQ